MDKRVVENKELLCSAQNGLRTTPKTLESKWFYDEAGSALFEQITGVPEYYPTRTEIAILQGQTDKLADLVPDDAVLVELGSGASRKTRILLDQLDNFTSYVPIDISAEFLKQSAAGLAADYPAISVEPVVADFMQDIQLPDSLSERPKVVFFPGSTIGNLQRDQAVELMARIRQWSSVKAFVLGIDLVKDPATLIRAYDDEAGVTAAFNLNLLHRLNRETGSYFDVSKFDHEARWNADYNRIEMHLVSLEAQTVQLGHDRIRFQKNESIHTENSHKYTEATFENIAYLGGWSIKAFLTDADNQFAVAALVPKGR